MGGRTKRNKKSNARSKRVHWNTTLEVAPSKVNCSPVVKNRQIVPTTCYTPDAITVIKNAYNKEHPTDPILATLPKDIWVEMQKRFTHCSKEDCWLEQIKETKLRKQLNQMIFAPDQPPEWKHEPNAWLSNIDIENVLNQYEVSHPHFKLLGPTPIDYDAKDTTKNNGECVTKELCAIKISDLHKKGKYHLGIVFNLDDHTGEGLHWTSMFVDIEHALIFYYDSALYPVPREVTRLKNEIIRQGKSMSPPIHFKYKRNKNTHQKTDGECGMYSLFFIVTFLTNETEFMKNMTLDQKMDLFCKKRIPDKYVEKYRKIYFNV